MREIKFRAWDIHAGEYYKPIHEAYKGNLHDLMLGLHGHCMIHELAGIHCGDEYDDQYIIEQYTGLHDKNDVEIYEGDILEIGIDAPVEVIWQSGSFLLCGGWLSGDDVCVYTDSGIIIGNIHENQELL